MWGQETQRFGDVGGAPRIMQLEIANYARLCNFTQNHSKNYSKFCSLAESIALAFDATKRAQMTMRATHDVFEENCVELCSSPIGRQTRADFLNSLHESAKSPSGELFADFL